MTAATASRKKVAEDALPPPKERVLRAAAELFYNEGLRAVGVEAIAAKAQTTKMAIYRHFESKDALITEWLRGLAVQYMAVFDELAAKHPGDARAQLKAWVQWVADGLYRTSHRGCPFIIAIGELSDRNHPGRLLVEHHKARQAAQVVSLCRQAGVPDPDLAAAELIFLLEGAQITAQNMGIAAVDEKIVPMAMRILDRAH